MCEWEQNMKMREDGWETLWTKGGKIEIEWYELENMLFLFKHFY